MLVGRALSGVFGVALYRYAVDGEAVGGFTSEELVRHQDGSFEVEVAPRARPGNWLPTGGVERYILVMRFYDTSLGIATRAGREAPMPAITSSGKCA